MHQRQPMGGVRPNATQNRQTDPRTPCSSPLCRKSPLSRVGTSRQSRKSLQFAPLPSSSGESRLITAIAWRFGSRGSLVRGLGHKQLISRTPTKLHLRTAAATMSRNGSRRRHGIFRTVMLLGLGPRRAYELGRDVDHALQNEIKPRIVLYHDGHFISSLSPPSVQQILVELIEALLAVRSHLRCSDLCCDRQARECPAKGKTPMLVASSITQSKQGAPPRTGEGPLIRTYTKSH